jgi:hypothetical protein
MQDAVSASVQRKVAVVNLLHAAEGVAPLVASVAPGRSVASVSVAGMFLRDFRALMTEWDFERNVGIDDPGSIPAGTDIRSHWICDKGHEWQAWLSDRVKRATGSDAAIDNGRTNEFDHRPAPRTRGRVGHRPGRQDQAIPRRYRRRPSCGSARHARSSMG